MLRIKEKVHKRILFLVMFSIGMASASAQTKPMGNFLMDSIKIGQPVNYALSFHHSSKVELLFPDSSYQFYPFEFISKKYFPTESKDSLSLDSVIYTLRTFEVKKTLELSLPVFIIDQGDTGKLFSTTDKIDIQQAFAVVPDTLIFKSDANYKKVNLVYNYPYYFTAAVIGFILLILFYFIFGKAVLRNYRLYIIYKNHVQFLRAFDKLHKELEFSPNLLAMEKILGEWKDYLTKLEQKPINTFTTTEIIALFNKEELKENLQKVDRSIYSGSITGEPHIALFVLKKFSNKRYKKRRKELRNER